MASNEKWNIVIEIPIFCSHSHRSKISISGLLKTRNSPSRYLWNGQRDKITVGLPWTLPSNIITKFWIPHPFSSNMKQCHEFSPPQRRRIQSILLYSPTYSPGWSGVLTLGDTDDMCITCLQPFFKQLHGSFHLLLGCLYGWREWCTQVNFLVAEPPCKVSGKAL